MTRVYMSADERRQQALSLIPVGGISSKDLCKAMGYAKSENAVRIVDALVFAGMVQSCRTRASDDPTCRAWVTMYFRTIEERDAFKAAREAQRVARTKQRKKDTSARMPYYIKRNAQRKAARAERVRARAEEVAAEKAKREAMKLAEAEQRKERQRMDREAKAAAKQREKAEAATQRKRLQAETRQAGLIAKVKAAKPAPVVVKARGPAFLDGPADESKAKVTKLPTPPDRFAVTDAPRVVSSKDSRKWVEAVAA